MKIDEIKKLINPNDNFELYCIIKDNHELFMHIDEYLYLTEQKEYRIHPIMIKLLTAYITRNSKNKVDIKLNELIKKEYPFYNSLEEYLDLIYRR